MGRAGSGPILPSYHVAFGLPTSLGPAALDQVGSESNGYVLIPLIPSGLGVRNPKPSRSTSPSTSRARPRRRRYNPGGEDRSGEKEEEEEEGSIGGGACGHGRGSSPPIYGEEDSSPTATASWSSSRAWSPRRRQLRVP